MNLITKYVKELKDRKKQIAFIKKQGHGHSYLDGIVTQLEATISDLTKQAMNDRFFLEEIVYKIEKEDHDHYRTLSRDWLHEYINNLPLSEDDRNRYINEILGHSDLDYYFKSESEMKFFLKHRRLPNDAETRSITIKAIVN